VRKPMAGALLVALLSIWIMLLGNARYLAVPALTLPVAKDDLQLVTRNGSSDDMPENLAGARRGDQSGGTLRVMTYNIHYGTGVSGELDLEQIATTIRAVNADIIGLQEVDSNFGKRSEFQDQPRLLARYLGMHYVYGESIRVHHLFPGQGTGYYGNMILSRYPIIDAQMLKLPTTWGAEARTALKAIIATPQGQIAVWSTHLGLSHRARLEQVRSLLTAVNAEERPCVILGDFNAVTGSPEISLMANRLQDTGELIGNAGGTFYMAASQTMPRIDYIWLDQSLDAISHRVVPSPASDHLAVVADLVVLLKDNQPIKGNIRKGVESDAGLLH